MHKSKMRSVAFGVVMAKPEHGNLFFLFTGEGGRQNQDGQKFFQHKIPPVSVAGLLF
jgi:hypothetical protein